MVQIIEPNDALSQLGQGLSTLPDALEQLMLRHREKKGRLAESEALTRQGFNIPGEVKNPRIREALLSGQQAEKTKASEFEADSGNYDTIKDAFGEKFADVWKASPTGARTELLRAGIDANLRGLDIKQIFGEAQAEMGSTPKAMREKIEFPEYKLNTEGRTPKETIAYQKELRGFNEPVFRESVTKKKSLEKQGQSFEDLKKLSPKIPQGFSRFFYDKGGNIRPLAQTLKLVPKEAEEYVKIINDFTTQAKDSYGSRVTNFDLQQFMKRLPTLANSEEGRELIIDRMRVQVEADKAYYDALQKVYKHYGQGKITPEDAEDLAQQISDSQIEELRNRAAEIDEEMNQLAGEGSRKNREQTPPQGTVLLLDPNGNPLHVPQEDVQRLLSLGARLP